MDINYSQSSYLSREEQIEMYSKLSKRELIELLLENQRLVENLATPSSNPPGTWNNEPLIWHGTHHPSTGEPLGPTYETNSTYKIN
jgi:hypothetical protein